MNSQGALTIEEIREGDTCVAVLAGRIDSTNANDLMARLKSLATSGAKSIVVDFGRVLYLTSAAFRALLVASDEAERNAAAFSLCGLAGHVRELFEMGGLLDLFTIHPSREEAIAKYR